MNEKPYEKWNKWNSGGAPKYPHNKLIQFMLRSYAKQDRESTRVLDLGCGSGVNTAFLAREGFRAYATDISCVGVKNTKRLLSAENLIIEEIKVGSISNIMFPEGFFDCVISVGVFDAAGINEARKSVKEINRILKRGGMAFILFAAHDDFRMIHNPLAIHGYNDNEVDDIFRIPCFKKIYVDHYKTTYANQTQLQHDYIITLFK